MNTLNNEDYVAKKKLIEATSTDMCKLSIIICRWFIGLGKFLLANFQFFAIT